MNTPEPEIIRLISRFGTFEAAGDSVIAFPDGLPGFESCRRFVLLRDAGGSPLMCLHSVDGPAAFLVVDPRLVDPGYPAAVTASEGQRLMVDADQPLVWLVTVCAGPDDALHANLRAPIVINPGRLIGVQVISEGTAHPLRSAVPLSRPARAEEQPCS